MCQAVLFHIICCVSDSFCSVVDHVETWQSKKQLLWLVIEEFHWAVVSLWAESVGEWLCKMTFPFVHADWHTLNEPVRATEPRASSFSTLASFSLHSNVHILKRERFPWGHSLTLMPCHISLAMGSHKVRVKSSNFYIPPEAPM